MRTNTRIALIVAGSLLAPGAQAVGLGGNVVYEKVDMVSHNVHFTDSFSVDTQGTYRATLTDFKFPNPLAASGLDVTTSITSLGKISGPGSFTFDADPGNYYVSLFASVAPISAQQRADMVRANEAQHGADYWGGLTYEQKKEQWALWDNMTPAEKKAHREAVWKRAERRVDQQLADMGTDLGQYGVQIALVNGTTATATANVAVVPLPGALWLFGSGLLALLGVRRGPAA